MHYITGKLIGTNHFYFCKSNYTNIKKKTIEIKIFYKNVSIEYGIIVIGLKIVKLIKSIYKHVK